MKKMSTPRLLLSLFFMICCIVLNTSMALAIISLLKNEPQIIAGIFILYGYNIEKILLPQKRIAEIIAGVKFGGERK